MSVTAPCPDEALMARALRLAERGICTTQPNPRVGCVIVRDGQVIGEGWHRRAGGAHAEVRALEAAGTAARGATAYVTLEPCAHHGYTPPCADALVDAGVARVVCAMTDPNPRVNGAGIERLRAAGVEVVCGVLETEAFALNAGFVQRMMTGRPFVTVKVAASLDGRVALGSGASQWITGEAARADVQRLRARSSAVVTGIGTLLADDPRLDVRAQEIDLQGRVPTRVVIDSRLRSPVEARTFGLPGRRLVLCTRPDEGRQAALEAAGVEVIVVASDPSGRVDLGAALEFMGREGCNEVLIEAGPELSGRFLERSLADEVIIYLAPVLLGTGARSMLALPPIGNMAARTGLQLLETRRIGADLRLRLRPSGG